MFMSKSFEIGDVRGCREKYNVAAQVCNVHCLHMPLVSSGIVLALEDISHLQ